MKTTRRRIWVIYFVFCFAILLTLLWLRWHFRELPNFTLIDDGICIGGYVDEPPSNATAVLNLSLRRDRYQAAFHRWEPIRDAAPAPNLHWIQQMVDWIDGHRRAGRSVYVHCQNGVSRSAMVVVAFVMYKKEFSRDQALVFVRAVRPIVRPNPAFMELLLQWQECLKSQKSSPNSPLLKISSSHSAGSSSFR